MCRLTRIHGLRIGVMALPFGMATLWFEQMALRLYPAAIKDQRAAAVLSFYGSLVIASLAYATIVRAVVTNTKNDGAPQPAGWRCWGSVAVIAILTPLGTMAGLAAALVPGIILWLSWMLAGPVAAVTGSGPFAAMRWSARSTWGSRRSLFCLSAVVHLSTLVISILVALGMGQSVWAPLEETTSFSTLEAITAGLVESLQLAASGVISCSAYQLLSHSKV